MITLGMFLRRSRNYYEKEVQTMKVEDWEFKRNVPDAEDIEAAGKASVKWFTQTNYDDLFSNESEEIVSAFHAGFHRGMSW